MKFKNIELESSPFGPIRGCGVYAVCVRTMYDLRRYGKERIIYIGSSRNVSRRVLNTSHPYRRMYNISSHLVYVKCYETNEFFELEKELIKHFRPICNKQHNA